MKKQVTSVNLDLEVKNDFISMYPYCMSRFLSKALLLAVRDRKFFEKVFYAKE